MSKPLRPARVNPPGNIIRRELEARGWTQKDLAEIMDRPEQTISEIIRGKKQITPDTAIELAQAFSTSPGFWLTLESNYRVWLAQQDGGNQGAISRRRRLHEMAPVAELKKRGWIKDTASLEELEEQVCAFLMISSPDQAPALPAAFRRSAGREPDVRSTVCWLKRAEHLARAQQVPEFDRSRLRKSLPRILALSQYEADVARIPEILLGLGVHFVLAPHLAGTYLDGAVAWVDDAPVAALTLRHDRIDAFWFTLMHELGHIVLGHLGTFVEQLYDDGEEESLQDTLEVDANRWAQDVLIDPDALREFIESAPSGRFSTQRVERFARAQARHPGIIVGRLHHEGALPYSRLKRMLVRVKSYLEPWIDVPHAQAAGDAA